MKTRYFLTAAFISILATACGPVVDPQQINDILALTGDSDNGLLLYRSQCQLCHGVDGSGGVIGPDIRDATATYTDEALLTLFIGGRGNMLPITFTNQQFADVLVYVRATFGGG